jgi:hypothetical protein
MVKTHFETKLAEEKQFVWVSIEAVYHELCKLIWVNKKPSKQTFYRVKESLPLWPKVQERISRKINLKPLK